MNIYEEGCLNESNHKSQAALQNMYPTNILFLFLLDQSIFINLPFIFRCERLTFSTKYNYNLSKKGQNKKKKALSQSFCFGPFSAAQMGGMILYSWVGSSSFLTSSSSSKMSFENAFGLALIQFCKATNGCTQSEPYKEGKWQHISNSSKN